MLPSQVVDCFWSLTGYGKPDYMLVPKPAGRYNVSTRSGLAFDEDGSLTLFFACQRPTDVLESNWLPTPANKAFTVDLRLYFPREEVRNGTWSPPPVEPSRSQQRPNMAPLYVNERVADWLGIVRPARPSQPFALGLVDQPLGALLLHILIELHKLDRVGHDPCFPAKQRRAWQARNQLHR